MVRTINASSSTAPASPMPNSLMILSPPSTKLAKTRTMIAAAAVITCPVSACPRVTAERLSWFASHSSQL